MIALLEGIKGLLVLVAGAGVIAVINHGAQSTAEHLVRNLHLNPARSVPHVFVELAGKADEANLWLLAGGAATYATVRLVQAFGLWNGYRWAEWLSIVSGSL